MLRSGTGSCFVRAITMLALPAGLVAGALSCGDGTRIAECPSGMVCPPGTTCAASQDVCISDGCGDGVVDRAAGEECDDGNIVSGDGCSSDCRSIEVCGNGYLDADEQCDDGGMNSDSAPDTCRTSCLAAYCGDGVKDAGEDCDGGEDAAGDPMDGMARDTATCNHDCSSAVCGDGIHNPEAPNARGDGGEECDTGGDSPTCNADCTQARCGDGYINEAAGEECDLGEYNSNSGECTQACQLPRCGDGFRNGDEVCDDTTPNGRDDGCSPQARHCNATCTACES